MDKVSVPDAIEIKDSDPEDDQPQPIDTKSKDKTDEKQSGEESVIYDESPGPSHEVEKPEIVEITDDSNSSNFPELQAAKPIVIEPDDLPAESSNSTKSLPSIIEIGEDSLGETQEAVAENASKVQDDVTKTTDEVVTVINDNVNVGDINEKSDVGVDNILEEPKLDKVQEKTDDSGSVEKEAKVQEINAEKTEVGQEAIAENESLPDLVLDTSSNTIENEVAALEKSTEEKVSEATDSTPVNGVDNVKPNDEEKLRNLPAHLIGHSLDAVKNGRVGVNPRLGVKVPYRNLSSQIVSKEEITDVIMERSRQRQAASEQTGNILFAKKLTHRLANKLLPGKKIVPPTETTVATAAVPVTPSNDRIANNSDLIALLEGDDDSDWNTITPKKDSDWERETALKQLQELPKLTGKRDTDDEPRFSLNPVTKTYTRKRKPSEDIKSILEAAKKPALTPGKTSIPTTPVKPSSSTPKLSPTLQKSPTSQKPIVQTPTILKSTSAPKPKGVDIKTPSKDPSTPKPKVADIKTPGKEPQREEKSPVSTKVKSSTLATPQKSILTPKQQVSSPKSSKSLSIQKSIQNIRNLSSTPALPPNTKLSTDKKAIIILSNSDHENNKSPETGNSNNKTPTPKKSVIPNTYISKSSRIVKRKKIWDPDEPSPTPSKVIKSPRVSERVSDTEIESTQIVKKAPVITAEKKTAKKIIKKAIISKKKKKQYRSEIDRLLQDEGAVNMLYSHKLTDKPTRKQKSVISLDKSQRELLHRMKAIKNDLLQNNNDNKDTPIGLRKKTPTFKDPAAVILHRKKSKDSVEGSLVAQTPPASPAYAYHENVSRIIRRHSSSSFTSKDSDDESYEDNTTPKSKKIDKKRESVIGENAATDDLNYSKFQMFTVRRFKNLVQIILVPTAPNSHTTLTLGVLKELIEILQMLELDDGCRVVVISSASSSFCLGIDYKELAVPTMKERKIIAKEYTTVIREFLLGLARFKKLLVAGVHGNSIGLGVTMLLLFDMVLASDTATFSTPYTRLGCAAEGGALFNVMHNALASELFFASRKLTAAEALRLGLVTRTLWPDKFQEELISALKIISEQSLQSMGAIKKQLRHETLQNVEASLKLESKVLMRHWISQECQSNFVDYSIQSK